MSQSLTIVQLYPKDMNIYGDWGNVLTLKKRCEWRNIAVTIHNHNPGDRFPDDVDIIVGGGGQDSGQKKIIDDLQKNASILSELADAGTPMLLICGLYQLFGHSFTTLTNETLPGIGIFDATTKGGDQRLIGNITLESDTFGTVIGYENHSGLTTLGDKATAFGTVISGQGNNTTDTTEGCQYKNTIGTYLHGSLLPKNPTIADFLIKQALVKKYGASAKKLTQLDSDIEEKARAQAIKRPR